MVERGGRARLHHVPNSGLSNLLPKIESTMHPEAKLFTDQHRSYVSLSECGYDHESVNHSTREFARGNVHTNTLEGVWAIFKRTIYGTYHFVSMRHLQAYCTEVSFKYSTRKMDDFERFILWFGNVNRSLSYMQLVKK
jgi:hypothetical protein